MSRKSFVKGATILAVAGLIAKVIGALFRIPLINILKDEGMAYYQMAYPIYSFILIVSTAGIPTAISKLVAEKLAIGNPKEAHRVFRISFRLMLFIGTVTFVLLFASSGLVARIVGSKKAIYSIMAITPSLLIVAIISALRGYFQGMQYMTPTAISQIVEQAGKLVFGLWFAMMFVNKGVEYAAAAAVAGVTLSEGLALALLVGIYNRKKKGIRRAIARTRGAKGLESNRSIFERLIKLSVPITIGSSIMPLIGVADMFIVVNRLKGIGYSQEGAEGLYGCLTGGANPLINFPAVFTIALAMSLVPAISQSYAARDYRSIAQKTTTGIRLTLLLGMPSAIGLGVLSYPISQLLYRKLDHSAIVTTGELLAILALGVLFLTLIQTLTSILQGINMVTLPVRNLFIGALFKIVFTYILVGNPAFNVKGAAIGTVICYGVAAVLNFIAVIRRTKIKIPFMDFIVKPLVAVAIMGVTVSFVYNKALFLGNTKSTLVSILAGALVYGIVLLLIGVIKKEDLALLQRANRG